MCNALKILAVVVGVALVSVPAIGQQPCNHCYPIQGHAYGPPVVHHQQYGNHHNDYYPPQKIVAQEIAVAPLVVTVPVDTKAVPVQAFGNPYYYSVSDAYREKAYLRDVVREELRALINGGPPQPNTNSGARSYQQPNAHTAPVTPSTIIQQAPNTGNSGGAKGEQLDDLTPPELQKAVLAAYQGRASCVSCHGPGGTNGFKLVLDDGAGGYRLTKLSSDKRWKVYGMASVGAMPPAAVKDANKAMEPQNLNTMLQYAAQKDQ